MITKLYQINRDYEEVKTQKRAGLGRRERRERRERSEQGREMNEEAEDEVEE
jgi:hypothetical protein